jgi:hypothetical protein
MIVKRIVEIFAVAAFLLPFALPGEAAVMGKPATQPKAKTATAEPTYTVLNPESRLPEIDTKGLSPRLTSLAGKTILIFDNHGGYEKPMAGLAAQLKPLLPPDTKLMYYDDGDFTKAPKADAVIAGHGY